MGDDLVCVANNGSLYDQFHTNVAGSGQLRDAAGIFNNFVSDYQQHQNDLRGTCVP